MRGGEKEREMHSIGGCSVPIKVFSRGGLNEGKKKGKAGGMGVRTATVEESSPYVSRAIVSAATVSEPIKLTK